jgi:hypothetical protein
VREQCQSELNCNLASGHKRSEGARNMRETLYMLPESFLQKTLYSTGIVRGAILRVV